MNIGLDIMGGDFAPLEAVKGLSCFYQNMMPRQHFSIWG
jgi:fatty acid/phospholipid biosynthesis enzyme